MASIKLKGDTSGEITIDVPAVAGTNTITLPAATGNVLTDGAALPAIDGSALTGVVPDKLSTASGSAPSYSARAWVNFNGTGTVAIRSSGNVSSITDRGLGYYQVNYTTAMPDANYAAIASPSGQYGTNMGGQTGMYTTNSNTEFAPLTTSCRFVFNNYSSNNYDATYVNFVVFK